MVHASIRMMIPPAKQEEVLGILGLFVQRARYDSGCLSCHVYRDGEMSEGILLDELWSDEESLDNHLGSPEFRNVLLVSEESMVPPVFRFETIQSLTGIETIEKARTFPEHKDRGE
jgi:quinol monooxygenase YgiN